MRRVTTLLGCWLVHGAGPLVQLCGPAEGLWEGELAVFRDIPYGQATRWQSPKAVCWNGTLDASVLRDVCPQLAPMPVPRSQSEDCLHINVWSANVPPRQALLPIVVFLHGGSNVFGWPGMFANIDMLAQNSSVCVMAPNYRLNAFGFLALSELAQTDSRGRGVSGNYGIEDLRAALQWVQRYGAQFGCDSERVTLMGQSSGGTNIFALLASSRNVGLFHRAIVLSGSANFSMSLAQAELQGRELVSLAGCEGSKDVAGCLRALPMQSILNATPPSWASTSFWPTQPSGFANPGLPCVDGFTIQSDLPSALSMGLVDVPVLFQSSRCDLAMFADPGLASLTPSAYVSFLQHTFFPWRNDSSVGQAVATTYAEVTQRSVWSSVTEFNSDLSEFCPHLSCATAAKLRSSVFVALVDQPPSQPFPLLTDLNQTDPFHGWDYIAATQDWNWVYRLGGKAPYTPTDTDVRYGDMLRTQWLEFAMGRPPGEIRPFNASGSEGYNVALLGDRFLSCNTTNVVNARADRCAMLLQNGLNPDSRFWLVN